MAGLVKQAFSWAHWSGAEALARTPLAMAAMTSFSVEPSGFRETISVMESWGS